ncbi:MAG: formate dehydrogenase accessory protein FdhE [Acetobacteraceae bacterium]|nr:formate dehydrogenase accessory protein FdhE [Acetobacteraceae bacterium]
MTSGIAAHFSGGVAGPEFVRLPDPATMFARRAERFAALADDSPLGPYLRFLAGIAEAQDAVGRTLPATRPVLPLLEQRLGHGMPALAKTDLALDDSFVQVLDGLLQDTLVAAAPDAARHALASLRATPQAGRIALAEDVFEGVYPVDRLGEALFVAAAVQVHLARCAASLQPDRIKPVGDGVCPVCGSAPAVSLVVGWAKADRARYCCCGLCGTLWNYVRIKCVSCGSTEKIGYLQIEGQDDIVAETCGVCRGYIKHLHQHRNNRLDPIADDVASYGLDLLVHTEGFKPVGINPLMITTPGPETVLQQNPPKGEVTA